MAEPMFPEAPRCTPIPVGRVLEKLDQYLNADDYAAAEKHLRYWQAEAEAAGDRRGLLTVRNEQIGLSRKLGREAEGRAAAAEALRLAEALELTDTVTMGTTLINAATAYKAFGSGAEALPLYRRAQAIYEASLSADDPRLGGLYNNMALTVAALGDHAAARALFAQAMGVMRRQPHGEPELAITCCNLADLAAAERGLDAAEAEINTLLEQALALLDAPGVPRDGYYAFVCEKCAPTFGYYGWFAAEQTLLRSAKECYERT